MVAISAKLITDLGNTSWQIPPWPGDGEDPAQAFAVNSDTDQLNVKVTAATTR